MSAKLTKAQCKQFRALFADLQTLDPAKVDSAVIKQRFDKVEEQLLQADADPTGQICTDFLHLRDRTYESFQKIPQRIVVPSDKPYTNGKHRMYLGISNGTKIGVRLYGDKLELSRSYSGQIIVRWEFDQVGKTQHVNLDVLNSIPAQTHTIIFPFQDQPDTDRLQINPFPPQITFVNPGLVYEPHIWKKYRTLMRYGYGGASSLLINLNRNAVHDFPTRKTNQRPLETILQDQDAMICLENCQRVIPEVRDVREGNMQVIYEPNPYALTSD